MQFNPTTIPADVIAQLNRAAHNAAATLKRDHGRTVSRRVLREHGAAVITEQAALSSGRHPDTPSALAMLHDTLHDLMIERAA